jgi:hypothetical protein
MFREFYSADPEFQAGVQGFMNWYNDEGKELDGVGAAIDTVYKYSLDPLSDQDVALLPLDDEILLNANKDTWGPRVVADAIGVISVASMDCTWTESERYLARPDQHVVFDGDWEAYEREYLASVDTFLGASIDGGFEPIDAPLDPFSGTFDDDAFERTLLRTVNQADPTKVLTSNIESYELNLDLRHGEYQVDGTEVGAFAILTYTKGAAWGSGGNDGLVQSYSIELNVETGDNRTMRMLAVFAQAVSSAADTNGALAYTFAVNKSLKASQRMSDVCAGEVEVVDW